MSFKAIETPEPEDEKQWLTYWVCFGVFQLLDNYAISILAYIPLYNFLKLGLVILLWHPKSMGMNYIYEHILEPLRTQSKRLNESFSDPVAEPVRTVLNM